jgi:hypothetical protein
MKKNIFFAVLFISQFANSQEILKYKQGGKVRNESGITLEPNAVRVLMADHSRSLALYNAGRSKKTVGNILLWGGATVFATKLLVDLTTDTNRTSTTSGNGFVTGVQSERVSPALYIVGGAMIVAAIPIKIGFSKKIDKAVDLYNKKITNKEVGLKIEEAYFLSNAYGLGVGLKLR